MALDRAFKARDLAFAPKVRIYNDSGATLEEGDPVHYSSGWVICVDANTVGLHGVVCEDISNTEYGYIWIDGEFDAAVAGTVNFAQADAVYSAASSEVDAGSQNDVAVGYVVHNDPANGASEVRLRISSLYRQITTHA